MTAEHVEIALKLFEHLWPILVLVLILFLEKTKILKNIIRKPELYLRKKINKIKFDKIIEEGKNGEFDKAQIKQAYEVATLSSDHEIVSGAILQLANYRTMESFNYLVKILCASKDIHIKKVIIHALYDMAKYLH
jgi:hypothetical protein